MGTTAGWCAAARAGSAASLQAHILLTLTWTISQIIVHSLTSVAADLRQVAQKDRVKNGELYRYIADNHGIFVQPAKYVALQWCRLMP